MIKFDGIKTGPWRKAKDHWDSRDFTFTDQGLLSYDKFQHGFFSLIGTVLIHLFLRAMEIEATILIAPFTCIFLGLLWEIKDGFIPDIHPNYIRIGRFYYCFGGDGFSYKDLLADWLGVQVAVIIISVIESLNLCLLL